MTENAVPEHPPERKPLFDILGVCVARDIFGLANGNMYEVRKYTRPSVPYFADDEYVKESRRLADTEVSGKTRYLRRRKLDDLNRTCREGLSGSGAEWLLLELRTVSYEYWEAVYGGKPHYFIGNTTTEEEMRRAVRKRGRKLESLRRIGINDIPGTPEMVGKACDFIRERYGGNVILLQQKEAVWHMGFSGKVALNRSAAAESMNSSIDRYFRMFLRNLGCRFVRMPPDIISDSWQRWGVSPAHYVQEYYDYAYACIDDIVRGIPDLDGSLDRRFEEFSAQLNAMRSGRMMSRNNAVSRIYSTLEKTGDTDLCIETALRFRENARNPLLEAELDGVMGKLLRDRTDGKADPGMAEELMGLSAEGGITWAQAEYLGMLRDSGRYAEMLGHASEYASRGCSEAMGFIGRAYMNGEGTGKNIGAALEWLERASAMDVEWAMQDYMQLLWDSDAGMLAEKAEGFSGHSGIAMGFLGRAYRDGRGVEKDLAKAREWLRKAAEKRVPWAREELEALKKPSGTDAGGSDGR